MLKQKLELMIWFCVIEKPETKFIYYVKKQTIEFRHMEIDCSQFGKLFDTNNFHLYSSKWMFDKPDENEIKEIDSFTINMIMDICNKTIGIDMAPYKVDSEIDSDFKKLNKKRKR